MPLMSLMPDHLPHAPEMAQLGTLFMIIGMPVDLLRRARAFPLLQLARQL